MLGAHPQRGVAALAAAAVGAARRRLRTRHHALARHDGHRPHVASQLGSIFYYLWFYIPFYYHITINIVTGCNDDEGNNNGKKR